ncbi:TRAP transporter large permease subunit [Thermus oshimai]|uniref:TRAP transporter large permease n=1 Tax=Thermus oshimai TaxID=56957 RepID=UPI0031FADEDB
MAALLLIALLFLLLALGVWIGAALFLVGLVGLYLADPSALLANVASALWSALSGWSLAALPLFIWMGEILYRSRLSAWLFAGLAPWLGRLPGGLLHLNVLGSAIFAAVIGSSAATTATVGRITLPELRRRGYPEDLAVGSLAGAGTLGFLIPPSIVMIVYGVMAEVSVARLFIAGVVPGLLLAALMMLTLGVWAALRKGEMPPPGPLEPLGVRFRKLLQLLPVLLLILAVIGSIYVGLATPTEAAALGVAGALLLSALAGDLRREAFWASLKGTVRTTTMIGFILAGASVLTLAMGFLGIPRALTAWAVEVGLTPHALILALSLVYLLMGMFLDGISMVVLTVSLLLPVVKAVGVDPIWFGVYLVLMVELAQITPPVGFNLFVLQGLTGRDILFIARSALPFLGVILAAVGLLLAFPELVLWLPRRMTGG